MREAAGTDVMAIAYDTAAVFVLYYQLLIHTDRMSPLEIVRLPCKFTQLSLSLIHI